MAAGAAMSSRAADLLRIPLLTVAWLSVAFWLFMLLRGWLADFYNLSSTSLWEIKYHYDSYTSLLWDHYSLAGFMAVVVPVIVASLAISLTEALPKARPRFANTRAKIGRVLGWQVPGRRFWSWWCGGLSFGEALFYIGFMGAVVSWFEYYLYNQLDYQDAIWQIVDVGDHNRALAELEAWSLCFGLALLPCFLCLFWPCAHDSFINHMLGIPWAQMIKFHRWMGHITMWVMTAHGVGYFILWGIENNFWPEFSSWRESIPFLPGSLSWFGGLALQITSLYYIRRKWFTVFYVTHIVGYVIVLFFGAVHYGAMVLYYIPSLIPWFVDIVMRFAQGSCMSAITSATLSDDRSVVTWDLTLDEAHPPVEPMHEFVINCPSVSRWSWHPFTVSRVLGNRVTFNTKKYGSFTTDLLHLLQSGMPVPVRVQGPIGIQDSEKPWLRYPVLVCVTGGIGISPVLAMLHSLITERAKGGGEGTFIGPRRVIVVWAARHKAEFTIMDETVLNAANDPNGWLSVTLHYTGANIERASSIGNNPKQIASESIKPMPADLSSSDTSDTGSDAGGKASGGRPKAGGGCPLDLSGALRFPWFSPLGFSLARPVQPKSAGPLHRALVMLLVVLGGFAGLTCASVWFGEGFVTNTFNFVGTGDPDYYWKLGILWFLGMFVGGLGLPVFATHAWQAYRYLRAARHAGAASSADSRCPSIMRADIRPAARFASTLVGGRVGFVETGAMLDIGEHRPDIGATLAEAVTEAAELQGGADVGVYAAGPHGMVQAAKLLVASLNSTRARSSPVLHFHQETWEL